MKVKFEKFFWKLVTIIFTLFHIIVGHQNVIQYTWVCNTLFSLCLCISARNQQAIIIMIPLCPPLKIMFEGEENQNPRNSKPRRQWSSYIASKSQILKWTQAKEWVKPVPPLFTPPIPKLYLSLHPFSESHALFWIIIPATGPWERINNSPG